MTTQYQPLELLFALFSMYGITFFTAFLFICGLFKKDPMRIIEDAVDSFTFWLSLLVYLFGYTIAHPIEMAKIIYESFWYAVFIFTKAPTAPCIVPVDLFGWEHAKYIRSCIRGKDADYDLKVKLNYKATVTYLRYWRNPKGLKIAYMVTPDGKKIMPVVENDDEHATNIGI